MNSYDDIKNLVNGAIALKALKAVKLMIDNYERYEKIMEAIKNYIALIDFSEQKEGDADV